MITQQVEMSRKPLYVSHSGVTRDRRSWLEDEQTLYIYSDVIDYQMVGKSKAMLMGVFPVNGKHGEQQSWQVNPFQYIDIPSSTIPSIDQDLHAYRGRCYLHELGHPLPPPVPTQDAIK